MIEEQYVELQVKVVEADCDERGEDCQIDLC